MACGCGVTVAANDDDAALAAAWRNVSMMMMFGFNTDDDDVWLMTPRSPPHGATFRFNTKHHPHRLCLTWWSRQDALL